MMNLGAAYMNLSQLNEAIAALREAIRLRPSLAEAHRNLGHALRRQFSVEEAIAEYRAAIRIRPGDSESQKSLGDALADQLAAGQATAERKDLSHAVASAGTIEPAPPRYLEAESPQAGAERSTNGESHGLAPQPPATSQAFESTWNEDGTCSIGSTEYKKAIARFKEATRIDAIFSSAGCNLTEKLTFTRKTLNESIAHHHEVIAEYAESKRLQAQPDSISKSLDWWKLIDLGLWRIKKREYDNAIADLSEAIQRNPQCASAYFGRGAAWSGKGAFAKARADYTEAVRIDPKQSDAHSGLAWLLATCPDARLRDGKKAVESATKACELSQWKSPYAIGTLAAAHAESGDFDLAVKMQTKAIELLTDEKEKADFRTRLELFHQKKPYRQPTPKGAREVEDLDFGVIGKVREKPRKATQLSPEPQAVRQGSSTNVSRNVRPTTTNNLINCI